jgi:hypothetical protein
MFAHNAQERNLREIDIVSCTHIFAPVDWSCYFVAEVPIPSRFSHLSAKKSYARGAKYDLQSCQISLELSHPGGHHAVLRTMGRRRRRIVAR